MTRFSRIFVSAVAASVLASPISAQRSGGLIGGVVGGLGGALGNTVGQVGGTVSQVGGLVGNTAGTTLSGLGGGLSGLGYSAGGVLGSRGLITGSSGRTSSEAFSQSLLQSGIFAGPAALDQVGGLYPADSASAQEIENFRVARLNALIAANRSVLDRDPSGQPVRKRELITTNPDAVSLAIAARAGFRISGDELEPSLGMRMVTLAIPPRMNVRQALVAIRRAAPAMQVDFNHIYEPSGGSLLPVAGAVLASSPRSIPRLTRIAMIDGGVAAHPSLARASIEQQGFAGDAQPTGHGTAVGSLLVGDQGPFRGAARGAQLFVADVYGGNPAAGSTSSIVRALSWAASKYPAVINISLVGPNNAALARAIGAVEARGIKVVAAVGNDGPAAPPQYPASYPGVVSVTGVDAQGKALAEAGRAGHLDFAAPGADMIAALPGQGFTLVRGTSFAAPLAAARLALTGSYERLAMEARPGKGKVGRGIVCWQCRVDPAVVRRK
jgi:hypothetical protein